MTLRDLLIKLESMADQHGDMLEVLVNHEEIDAVILVREFDGCPEYISIEPA